VALPQDLITNSRSIKAEGIKLLCWKMALGGEENKIASYRSRFEINKGGLCG